MNLQVNMNMQVNTGCQQGLSQNQFGFLDTQHGRQVSPSGWGSWGEGAPHLPRFMNYFELTQSHRTKYQPCIDLSLISYQVLESTKH